MCFLCLWGLKGCLFINIYDSQKVGAVCFGTQKFEFGYAHIFNGYFIVTHIIFRIKYSGMWCRSEPPISGAWRVVCTLIFMTDRRWALFVLYSRHAATRLPNWTPFPAACLYSRATVDSTLGQHSCVFDSCLLGQLFSYIFFLAAAVIINNC